MDLSEEEAYEIREDNVQEEHKHKELWPPEEDEEHD